MEVKRNSFIQTGSIYFWTATIHNWIPLLQNDKFKQTIINSLNYLHNQQLIEVYGFVIMPNHIHLLWKELKLNGKETPHASLLKYTAHLFKKELQHDMKLLMPFAVQDHNKKFEFWQRDSLAFEITQRDTAI